MLTIALAWFSPSVPATVGLMRSGKSRLNTQQGTTTKDAVHRGIMLSIVGAINEVSTRHPNFEIIMTGGDAAIIAQHVNRPVRLRDDLLLNGLARYFDHEKQS